MLRATLAILIASGLSFGQHATNAKSHILTGKVTEVGKTQLTVNHGNVEGYMGAMTMGYKVDKPEVLTKVKVGDQIQATVYDADYTLYNVKVVPSTAKSKK